MCYMNTVKILNELNFCQSGIYVFSLVISPPNGLKEHARIVYPVPTSSPGILSAPDVQSSLSGILYFIYNTPWCVGNLTPHRDAAIPFVAEEIHSQATSYFKRLSNHENDIVISTLLQTLNDDSRDYGPRILNNHKQCVNNVIPSLGISLCSRLSHLFIAICDLFNLLQIKYKKSESARIFVSG